VLARAASVNEFMPTLWEAAEEIMAANAEIR
jgi:hypothetical protein